MTKDSMFGLKTFTEIRVKIETFQHIQDDEFPKLTPMRPAKTNLRVDCGGPTTTPPPKKKKFMKNPVNVYICTTILTFGL